MINALQAIRRRGIKGTIQTIKSRGVVDSLRTVRRMVADRPVRPSRRRTLGTFTLGLDSDAHIQSYFDTFGFVRIQGALTAEMPWINREFDSMMAGRFGRLNEPKSYLYPQFIDNSPELWKLLENENVLRLAELICGTDFIYKGSDGVCFPSASNWHRDYLIRSKSCKMLVYLEKNTKTSGPFCAIAGSHFIDDSFSSFLSHALTWPEPPVGGGFNEKQFFGAGNDPRIVGDNRVLPYVEVETTPGDIIIFNHNLVHCVNRPHVKKRRRLLGLHFAADMTKQMPGDSRAEAAMDMLRAIAISEINQFKLKNFYGPYIQDTASPIVRKQTRFLRDLTLKAEGQFNGFYEKQSQESLDLLNSLKTDVWRQRRFQN